MLYLVQKLATYLLAKLVPLSEMTVFGNPEAPYYVLSEELDNFLLADLEKRYCLNPLGKVVGGD